MKNPLFYLITLCCLCKMVSGQNFWQQTNGPFGGTTINSVHCGDNGNIYAATNGLGIFKSIDQGASWIKLNQAPAMAYTIVSNKMGDVFAGTTKGVYRSMDFGNTWVSLSNDLSSLGIRSMLVNQKGDIFAGSESNGIYRSSDNGDTWTHLISSINGVQTLAKNGKGDIYAGTWETGIYRSKDNGDSWNSYNYGLGNIQIWQIAINNEDVLFTATRGGVFKSTDGGDHWKDANHGLTGYLAISIAVGSGGLVFAGLHTNLGVFVSTDSGENWSYSGLSSILPWSLTTDFNGNVYAAGDILYKSTDNAANWSPIGLNLTTVSSFAKNLTGDVFAITDRLFRTHDMGSNWIGLMLSPDRKPASIAINDNNDIWLGTDWGIFLSEDNGITWSDKGLPQNTITAVLIHSNGNVFASNGFNRIFCSTDYGKSWVEKHEGIPSNVHLSSLRENPAGILFAGTAEHGIFRSVDTAITWVGINNGLTNLKINAIAIKNQQLLFVATHGGGVFRSSDNGDNWTQVINGFTNLFVRSLAISQQGQIIAATYAGAFISVDDGANWIAENDGLSNVHLNSILIDPNGYLYTGTVTTGAYRSVNSINGYTDIPFASSVLYQIRNYPNPFNETTTISWQQPKDSHVILKVYDFMGREVKTLLDCDQAKGEHLVKFDATCLQSGVYFYQIQADGKVETKKMIIQ